MPKSNNPIRASMAHVLGHNNLNAETVDLVIEVVASDAAFNTWVLWSEKEQKSAEKMLSLMESYQDITDKCCSAVDVFLNDAAEAELRGALSAIIQRLKTVSTA